VGCKVSREYRVPRESKEKLVLRETLAPREIKGLKVKPVFKESKE
jgi:hypothetical protein